MKCTSPGGPSDSSAFQNLDFIYEEYMERVVLRLYFENEDED